MFTYGMEGLYLSAALMPVYAGRSTLVPALLQAVRAHALQEASDTSAGQDGNDALSG